MCASRLHGGPDYPPSSLAQRGAWHEASCSGEGQQVHPHAAGNDTFPRFVNIWLLWECALSRMTAEEDATSHESPRSVLAPEGPSKGPGTSAGGPAQADCSRGPSLVGQPLPESSVLTAQFPRPGLLCTPQTGMLVCCARGQRSIGRPRGKRGAHSRMSVFKHTGQRTAWKDTPGSQLPEVSGRCLGLWSSRPEACEPAPPERVPLEHRQQPTKPRSAFY